MIEEYHLELDSVEIIDQRTEEMKALRERYAQKLFKSRQRKGMTYEDALGQMYQPNQFGMMMVTEGDVGKRKCAGTVALIARS